MHFPSLGPLIVVLIIVLVLFGGRGKISQVMGDFAKGIKSFKKGLADEDKEADLAADAPVQTIEVEAEAVTGVKGGRNGPKKTPVRRTRTSKS